MELIATGFEHFFTPKIDATAYRSLLLNFSDLFSRVYAESLKNESLNHVNAYRQKAHK